MPTYQYACTECGHRFEAVQAFSDDALTSCPECGGQLRKVYGSVGVVFKGSGFYRTDSRSNAKSTTPANGKASDGGSSGSSGSSGSGDSSSTSTPAPSPAASSSSSSSAGSSKPAPKAAAG